MIKPNETNVADTSSAEKAASMPENDASMPEKAVSGYMEGGLMDDSVVCKDIKKAGQSHLGQSCCITL